MLPKWIRYPAAENESARILHRAVGSMSLIRLIESRRLYAREWKIVWWTLGMTVAVFLITDGKTTSEHPLLHLLIGAALGLFLGSIFSRHLKANASTTVK
jgi:hypothetical protein